MATARGFLVALTLLVAAPAVAIHAQAPEDRSNDGHWWCSSMAPEGPVYITGLWNGKHILAEVLNAFAQELLATYAYKGRVNCARANVGSTPAQIQSGPSSQIAAWRSSGRKVIEMPWIYDPARANLPHLCTSIVQVQASGNVFYHNKVLRIPGETQAQLSTAWSAHVKERHPGAYFLPMGCNLLPADPAQHQSHVDGFVQMYSSKGKIVALDWTFAPAVPAGSTAGRPYAAADAAKPAAPATTPAAAPRAGGVVAATPTPATASVQHAICYGDADPAARYFSAAFDGTRGDYADWMPAFQKFLEQTYKYRGFVRCNKQPSQAAAQKYLDTLIAGARGATLAGGAKLKVVETGWIYKN